MNKQEYIKELKEEIAYEKEMIAKGDHVEERKQEVKDMQADVYRIYDTKSTLWKEKCKYLGKSKVSIKELFDTVNDNVNDNVKELK